MKLHNYWDHTWFMTKKILAMTKKDIETLYIT